MPVHLIIVPTGKSEQLRDEETKADRRIFDQKSGRI